MATPPVPMLNPNRAVDSEMRFEDPQFPQLASEERYNNLIKETLNTISINEGTNNLNLVKSKKAKKIIKNPYDMVGYFGRYLVPEKAPTKMTIREVIDFGRKLVNATQNKKDSKGKKLQPTSAMGKYQIMSNSFGVGATKVLEEFSNKLNLDLDTQLFTPEIQDAIAIRMIEERVPSLKDFAMSETDENINKVIDELNGTWRGIADSEGKTSKGQNVGRLSAEEIKNKLINIKQDPGEYGVGSDVDDTERMLKEEKAEPAKKERIDPDRPPQATKDKPKLMEFEGVEPFNEEERTIKLQMEAINPMGSANADESLTTQSIPQLEDIGDFMNPKSKEVKELSMPEENAASDYEKAFDKYDGELPEEEEDSISYSQAIEPEDSVVDREGMDYDTPEVTMEADPEIGELIANLFNSKNMMADETEMFDDQEYQNLKEGGEVEADFVDDDKEDDATDPPPGATPEQVADDIPAMLSEGEYVLPANVVNYLGLKNITEMHQAVLDEIQQMADLGFVENVDENGKPEDDDDEMPKVKKNGDVESPDDMEKSATLIIASASPKGMMCPEPVMLKDGGADFDPFGGSEAEVEFEAEAEFDPMGSQETDFGYNDPDLGIQQYSDFYSPPSYEKSLEDDQMGRRTFAQDTEEYLSNARREYGDAFAKGLGVALDRTIGIVGRGIDAAVEVGEQKRDTARGDAAEKARAEGKTGSEITDAMNEAYSAPGFSASEQAAFEGGAKGMNEGMDTPGGPNNMDGFISDAELEVASSSTPTTQGYKRQFIPGVGLVRDGGLMSKGYNTGGQVTNFVPDVGIVPISSGFEMDQLPSSSLMSYKDILTKTRAPVAEAYGFKSWDEASKAYKDKPKLEGAELSRRQKDAKYITNRQFTGIDGSNQYAKDPFLENTLRKYNVDFENFADVMSRYRSGEKMLSDTMSVVENEKLKNDLTGYANEKRISRFGFTPQDASQLPEGSTNRDVLKSLFRTQINFEEDAVDQQNTDLAGNINDPKGFQRRFKPSAHRNFKESVLNEGIVDPKIEQYLRLDEPMNVETVNRVTAYLNTGGDQQYVDPNNERYSEDIFAKYDDLKALSPSSGLLSPSEDLGTYVKDVGYV
tara:strand:+ start:808 stop:4113 length:3306 start_codon:yes stop_codon:yes gene_type:complete